MASNVNTNLANWSTTAASNKPAGSDTSDTDAELREIQAVVRKYMRNKGADIASASTTDLATATGDYVDITGTATITSLGTVSAGMRFILQFDAAATLTHNATSLILPGGANITTAAGDHAIMESLGSGNWVCVAYQKASGAPIGSFQPLDATLTALAGVLTAANKIPYATALNTAGELDFIDDDTMATASATSVSSSESVKAYADTKNIAIQVAPGTSGNVLTSNGSAWTSAAPAASSSIVAWVYFTGTSSNGAQTINAQSNVTSVERTGTGKYTVTMTTALADTNYAYMVSAKRLSVSEPVYGGPDGDVTKTTTVFGIETGAGGFSNIDCDEGYIIVVR